MTVPVTVVALSAANTDDRAALIELFEVGDRGAVVVRPDGHVVWRNSIGAAAADQLVEFVESAWADVYPTWVPDLQEAP